MGSSGPSEGTFEHCKAVTTLRSGKVVDKTIQTKEPTQDSQSELVREDEVSDQPHVPNTNEIDGEPEEDKSTHVPPAPYPHRLRVPKKLDNHSEIYELFKEVKLNIPLLDAIKQIPSYAKFLKDLCTIKRKLGVNKEAFMTEQSTSLIRNNLPPKYKDPGSPTISIVVGNSKLGHALVDLGASINLLPYSVYVDLGLGELEPTNITLQLAYCSVKIFRGIVKDVLVLVDKFYFPVDFVVLEKVTTLESEFLYSIIERHEILEVNGWAPKFEPFPPNEDKALLSEERPPKLELKPLPTHLKYSFLGEEETFLVIISSSLGMMSCKQKLQI